MAVNLSVSVTGDTDQFARAAKAMRNPRTLLKRVGVLVQSSAAIRLTKVLRQDGDGVRTGRLMAAFPPGDIENGTPGSGTEDTIFDLDASSVTVGVNLPYAAQVHFGGTIVPKAGKKALAIPLIAQLQRSGLGPLDIDPDRSILTFLKSKSGKPNVIGVLVDNPQPLTGRQRKKRGGTPYGPGVLFALVSSVTQPPRPFLFFDADDRRTVREDLFPQWIAGR